MNANLDGLARLAWDHLWQVTVVAIVIGGAVKTCCRERPRLAYALWMLVVVKAIVPPVWSTPTGLFSWAGVNGAASRPTATEPPPIMSAAPPPAAPVNGGLISAPVRSEGGPSRDARSDGPRFHLYLAVFSIWATGSVLCTAFVLGKQIACSILLRRSRLPSDARYVEALADLSQRLGVRRGVRLFVTARPIGPAVFGLFRPSILLPEALLSGQPSEQVELVLAHELVHVRRGDIFAGKLQLAAQLLWWFHPLVWWANREACRERERCCDEEVVSGVGCRPALYARALLSVLEQKKRLRSPVALPGVRALEVTSIRLESIMKYAGTDHRRASFISRLVFAAGAAVLVPGAGPTLRVDPSADDNREVASAGQTTAVAGAPNARAGDHDGAKAQPASKGDGGESRGSLKAVRSESALERLGEWLGMGALTMPETEVIRRGLRLTDDQVARITKVKELREEKLSPGFRGPLDLKLTGSPRTWSAQITAFVNREAGESLVEILTPAQCERLEQIILTSHGVRAFRYPDVRKELRLAPEQEGKIDAIIEGLFARLRGVQEGPGGQPKDYEGAMALEGQTEPLWDGSLEQVLALLTPDQSARWRGMVGEAFRADEAEPKPTPMDR